MSSENKEIIKDISSVKSLKELEEDERKKREEMFEKTVQFQCQLCGLCEMCQYQGKEPPFVKNLIEFKEECYVMVDPFAPRQSRAANSFLVLGGKCDVCSKEVCVGCSIFYTKRVCIKCAQFNINEFPKDVQKKIVRQAESVSKT